jgi:hypothetical protein
MIDPQRIIQLQARDPSDLSRHRNDENSVQLEFNAKDERPRPASLASGSEDPSQAEC